MKTTAIICEFDPLHSGHKKLLDYAKTFSDKVICIMSGNFTQRGLPACADKYSRATHAIKAGADMVVELPTVFATASAENFALGGVKIAQELNVDYLLFGSECGDIHQIKNFAESLDDVEINERIAREVKNGVSYPKAVFLATRSKILESPNNVLAIEYVRAIQKLKSRIEPITLKRENNYNGEANAYASSNALRANKSLRSVYSYDYVRKDIDDEVENKFCSFATYFMSLASPHQLERIEGVNEGLENRIYNADKSMGYEAMISQIKTKRYTRLKLQRIVLNFLLSITKETAEKYKSLNPSIQVLAINSSSVSLLQYINDSNDEITLKADRLYYSLSGKKAPKKLIKIDV